MGTVTIPTLSQRPEAGEFARGKSVVMADHLKAVRAVRAAMASMGHETIPGTALELETFSELDAKMKLSDLNAKITQGALDRNEAIATTQQGYDLSVYAAAFETRKANALAALQTYLLGLKNQQSIDDEAIAQAAIQIDGLRITLLEARTAIELQVEAINQQIATQNARTAPYQVTLAQAKRDNATARLALIPVLQALLVAEQQTLSDKSAIYPLYTEFNTALKAVVDYRVANVIPKITANANQEAANANARIGLLPAKTALTAAEAATLVQRVSTLLPAQQAVVAALSTAADKQLATIAPLKLALAKAEQAYAVALAANVPTKLSIVAQNLTQSSIRLQVATQEYDILTDRLAVETDRVALAVALHAKEVKSADNELTLTGHDETLTIAQGEAAARAQHASAAVAGTPDGTTFTIAGTEFDARKDLEHDTDDQTKRITEKSVDTDLDEQVANVRAGYALMGFGTITAGGKSKSYFGSTADETIASAKAAGDYVAGQLKGQQWTDAITLLGNWE